VIHWKTEVDAIADHHQAVKAVVIPSHQSSGFTHFQPCLTQPSATLFSLGAQATRGKESKSWK